MGGREVQGYILIEVIVDTTQFLAQATGWCHIVWSLVSRGHNRAHLPLEAAGVWGEPTV